MVPRLMLALGVIVWAVIMVLLTRRRRPVQPERLPLASADPVAEVLADARPVSRFAGEQLDVNDLRWMVSVEELELTDEGGCNTVVGLDDTVSSYAEVYDDGFADALSDQPGIEAVDHADREVVLVRSLLSLPDVQAAAIRALLAINADPQVPRERPMPAAAMNDLADSVAGIMAGHGFVGRLRMSPEHDQSYFDAHDRHGPSFYRLCAQDRLVQIIGLRSGIGYHNSDGTIVNVRVRFTIEVVEVAAIGAAGSSEPDGCQVVAGERILSAAYDPVPAKVESIEHMLVRKALPLCDSTTSRAAIVDRWVTGLPWHVPDMLSWQAADIAARWGFRKHARDLLKHTPGRHKQAAEVAARHHL
ncbi:hypothetical protein Rhe02_84620 [Rhizocola hellebori]|uniref:Uncharacterized protein n=1 Tax=Rhizocola hellebori TaxID=1392758 RepID=A0A8J3QGF4_9ACTN|nr:hypothetical protein Rhe02_84620 [Rhizocola hellebori]